MLLYRGYLLQEALQKPPGRSQCVASETQDVSVNVQKCLNSALKVAEFAAELADDSSYNAVYWV